MRACPPDRSIRTHIWCHSDAYFAHVPVLVGLVCDCFYNDEANQDVLMERLSETVRQYPIQYNKTKPEYKDTEATPSTFFFLNTATPQQKGAHQHDYARSGKNVIIITCHNLR